MSVTPSVEASHSPPCDFLNFDLFARVVFFIETKILHTTHYLRVEVGARLHGFPFFRFLAAGGARFDGTRLPRER